MSRDSPPGQEDTQRRRPEIGRHADEVAHEADLGLANLGHRAAKVVVGRHRKDVDAFSVGKGTKLAAAWRRPIERIAVRPLAVDFDSVIAILLGSTDHGREWQSLTAVPESQVSDAVESQFHRNSSLRLQNSVLTQPGFCLGNRVFCSAKNPVSKAETGLSYNVRYPGWLNTVGPCPS